MRSRQPGRTSSLVRTSRSLSPDRGLLPRQRGSRTNQFGPDEQGLNHRSGRGSSVRILHVAGTLD
jgi:hypothetical protein